MFNINFNMKDLSLMKELALRSSSFQFNSFMFQTENDKIKHEEMKGIYITSINKGNFRLFCDRIKCRKI